MKTAQQFLKEKGLKDTLFDVDSPGEERWIKGGLSELLDEYAEQFKVKFPTDEEVLRIVEKIAYHQLREDQSDDLLEKIYLLREFMKNTNARIINQNYNENRCG